MFFLSTWRASSGLKRLTTLFFTQLAHSFRSHIKALLFFFIEESWIQLLPVGFHLEHQRLEESLTVHLLLCQSSPFRKFLRRNFIDSIRHLDVDMVGGWTGCFPCPPPGRVSCPSIRKVPFPEQSALIVLSCSLGVEIFSPCSKVEAGTFHREIKEYSQLLDFCFRCLLISSSFLSPFNCGCHCVGEEG